MSDTHTHDETAAMLAAMVPNAALVDQYAVRTLAGGITDMRGVGIAHAERDNLLIDGPTSTGKSLLARTYAASIGRPYYAVPVNVALDPSTIWGQREQDDNGRWRWVWSPVAHVVMAGGVVEWQELNMAHPKQLAAFYGLLDDTRQVPVMENNGAVLRAHDETLHIATMNYGYAGVSALNDALARRFNQRMRFDYVREVESRLLNSASLLDLAYAIRALPEVTTDLGTATLQMVERVAVAANVDYALNQLVETFKVHERGGVGYAVEMAAPAIAAELS